MPPYIHQSFVFPAMIHLFKYRRITKSSIHPHIQIPILLSIPLPTDLETSRPFSDPPNLIESSHPEIVIPQRTSSTRNLPVTTTSLWHDMLIQFITAHGAMGHQIDSSWLPIELSLILARTPQLCYVLLCMQVSKYLYLMFISCTLFLATPSARARHVIC